jgi:probable F420-dependent oxidoreductase
MVAPLPLPVGINVVWLKPELQLEAAKMVEDLGFDAVWTGEHICLDKSPQWWLNWPSAEGTAKTEDNVVFGPNSDFLDPIVAMTGFAAVTKRVRVGCGIYMLPLRDAVLVAKMVASLDVISNGRLDLAVGLGWSEAEWTNTGNDFKKRGKKMDETIKAMRVLFDEDTPVFEGEFYKFGPLGFEPKPIQKPLPIQIGGFSPAAERRAARIGNGWHGSVSSVANIKELLKEYGRENEPFHFSSTSLGPLTMEELESQAKLGIHTAVLSPWKGAKVGQLGREGFKVLEDYAKSLGL